MSGPSFSQDRATESDIYGHLVACDLRFVPPLSTRLCVREYAARIFERAARFEAWTDKALVGLVAIYCNSPDRREAFVTNVSVVQEWTRRGIARHLMESCIAEVRASGFERVVLDVDKNAGSAIELYCALNFIEQESHGDTARMCLELTRGQG